MLIPKEFKVFGKTITVEYSDSIMQEQNALGLWYSEQLKIILQRPTLVNKISTELIEQTFFHEVVHCIFDSLHYDKLNDNEVLVEQVSAMLHQILNSFSGTLKC